jgi:bacterioferritin-associated ferredoxin
VSAIEDARAALAQYDRASIHTVLTTVPAVAQTLRELIAEHERLAATVEGHGGWNEWIAEHVRVTEELERLTAPPADDEREALAAVIHQAHHDGCNEYTIEDGAYADAILAAGFHRQWQIADAQVEAAAGARRCSWSIPEEDHPVGKLCRMEGHCLDTARAMLEAARDAS